MRLKVNAGIPRSGIAELAARSSGLLRGAGFTAAFDQCRIAVRNRSCRGWRQCSAAKAGSRGNPPWAAIQAAAPSKWPDSCPWR